MPNADSREATLLSWREDILDELAKLKKQLSSLMEDISKREVQLRNIDSLLESEGYTPPIQQDLNPRKDDSISDHAFTVLKETNQPWYYKELADKLKEIGVHIPGQDRAANLLSHISRDERFERVKRGTYALSEWKTKALNMSRPGKHNGNSPG